jgi:hypothetical protein
LRQQPLWHETANIADYKGVKLMTSWNRGRENEEMGERQMNDNDPGNNLEGMGRKVGGEIEQGIDNLGDTITGKQNDLKGHERNAGAEAQEWAEHRGNDMDKAGDTANRWVDNTGNDINNAADRAGQWIDNRGDDIKRKTD